MLLEKHVFNLKEMDCDDSHREWHTKQSKWHPSAYAGLPALQTFGRRGLIIMARVTLWSRLEGLRDLRQKHQIERERETREITEGKCDYLPGGDEEERSMPCEGTGSESWWRRWQFADGDQQVGVLDHHGHRQYQERARCRQQRHLPAPAVHAFIVPRLSLFTAVSIGFPSHLQRH